MTGKVDQRRLMTGVEARLVRAVAVGVLAGWVLPAAVAGGPRRWRSGLEA